MRLLRAAARGHKGHITRAHKLLNKALQNLQSCSYLDAEAAYDNFTRMHANFNSAVQKWMDSIGLLRPAIQMALVTAEDIVDKVKSKSETDMLEDLRLYIEAKESDTDELLEKMVQMQRDAAGVLADRQEVKDKVM